LKDWGLIYFLKFSPGISVPTLTPFRWMAGVQEWRPIQSPRTLIASVTEGGRPDR
jgi:hypothetical protein